MDCSLFVTLNFSKGRVAQIACHSETTLSRTAKIHGTKGSIEVGLLPVSTMIRDWSLITGRGGATKREGGGSCEVLPLPKGEAQKVLAMLKGGHKKFWGSFYEVA